MVKIVVENLNPKRDRRTRPASVMEKRMRDPDGRLVTFRTIDAASPTFGEDLQYVFDKNVARARRENKRLAGSPDAVAPKR